MNPFDYVKAINSGKDIIRKSESPELAEKSYEPFLTNRSFSYHNDTLMQANEMNQRPDLGKQLQYDFYLNSIRPRKRYGSWSKTVKVEAVELVKEYYGYNKDRALEAVSILSDEQIDDIRKKLYRGGANDK